MSKVTLEELVQEANSASRIRQAWLRIVDSAVKLFEWLNRGSPVKVV